MLDADERTDARRRRRRRRDELTDARRGGGRERWQRLHSAEWALPRDLGAPVEAFADGLGLDGATNSQEAASRLLTEAVDRAGPSNVAATRARLHAVVLKRAEGERRAWRDDAPLCPRAAGTGPAAPAVCSRGGCALPS